MDIYSKVRGIIIDVATKRYKQLGIKTLRLFLVSSYNAFQDLLNKKLNKISQINLDYSLKNLTIMFRFDTVTPGWTSLDSWRMSEQLIKIFKEKHFII